jgi:hypothetical protein
MFPKDGTKYASQASYGMKGNNMKHILCITYRAAELKRCVKEMKIITIISLAALLCGCSTATETSPVVKKIKPEEALAVRTEVGNAILDTVVESLDEGRSFTGAKPCQTQGEAQLLIKGNLHLIRSPQRCPFAEHKGYFLFAGLTTEKPDDGLFKTGYAVKKGSTTIHSWERK